MFTKVCVLYLGDAIEAIDDKSVSILTIEDVTKLILGEVMYGIFYFSSKLRSRI